MATFATKPDFVYRLVLNEGGDHVTSFIPDPYHDFYYGGSRYEYHINLDQELFPLHDDEDMNEARCIKIADMKKGGFVELVTGHGNGESNRVLFLSTKRESRLVIKSSIELPCTSNMNTNAIALADLDNDGHLDIVMGNSMQRNQVLLNFLGDGMMYKQSEDDPRRVFGCLRILSVLNILNAKQRNHL